MSAIIRYVAPAELLFQPTDDKKSSVANREIEDFEPGSICEPEQRFWKLSARAASPRFAIIEGFILVLNQNEAFDEREPWREIGRAHV